MAAGNRRFVLREIRDALRHIDASVVFLQEIVGHTERRDRRLKGWSPSPQFEYLADSLWEHYAYGRNAVYSHGHHGNAILSKYPIESVENIDLSLTRWERRGLLHATVAIPGRSNLLHLGCLHLNLLEFHRRRQINMLCQRIEDAIPEDDPLIIAGDFNDWRGLADRRLMEIVGLQEAFSTHRGSHARTFPAAYPVFPLDRIYLRGFDITRTRVLDSELFRRLSDHLGLHVEAQLNTCASV